MPFEVMSVEKKLLNLKFNTRLNMKYCFREKMSYSPPECEAAPALMTECLMQASVDGVADLGEEDMDWL